MTIIAAEIQSSPLQGIFISSNVHISGSTYIFWGRKTRSNFVKPNFLPRVVPGYDAEVNKGSVKEPADACVVHC